jgi:hypothetical protein
MYRDASPGRGPIQFSRQSVFVRVSSLRAKSAAIFLDRVLERLFFSWPWKLLVNAYNMAAHDSSAQTGFLGRQVSLYSFFLNAPLSPTLKAFPLDSNSRFVMIYRGGKSF